MVDLDLEKTGGSVSMRWLAALFLLLAALLVGWWLWPDEEPQRGMSLLTPAVSALPS